MTDTPAHQLYNQMAWLWPLMSPPEDYQDEAAQLRKQLAPKLRHITDRKPTLLELGSGGGHMVHHLREHYAITATDLSPAMLKLSRKLNPDIAHQPGDMRTLRLKKTFDIVFIHDALGYMTTAADLKRAIQTAWVHLEPQGLLVLMPDDLRETFADLQTATDVAETDDGKRVTLISHVQAVDPAYTQYDLTMTFFIEHQGKTRVVEDCHRCGLFAAEEWSNTLTQIGFDILTFHKQPAWRGAPFILARRP